MCDDERALLRNIKANPDDDLPRLVYADWLEERRWEESAASIREQCEDPVFEERSHDFGTAIWHRGFVYEYRCTMNAWLANGPLICEHNPVQRVEITDKEPFTYQGLLGGQETVWFRAIGAAGQHCLKAELFDCNAITKRFHSPHDAYDWLSRRCIEWANAQSELVCHP